MVDCLQQERERQKLKLYKPWVDYLDIGYFPNAEGHLQAIGNNLRTAWAGRKERNESNVESDIFLSPVLKDIQVVGDASMLVVISPSNTIDLCIERLYGKVQMGFMVTGVMGPNALPFYQAGQVVGIAVGLKGVYDFEYMMKYGVNVKGSNGKVKVEYMKDGANPVIEPITVGTTMDRGQRYFFPLHIALGLMILAVILGNVAMLATRKKEAK